MACLIKVENFHAQTISESETQVFLIKLPPCLKCPKAGNSLMLIAEYSS